MAHPHTVSAIRTTHRVMPMCALRAGLVAAVALLAVLAPQHAEAQVNVNYGRGTYGQYRRDLVRFAERSQALIDEIRAIELRSTYCSQADRNVPGGALAETRTKLSALDRDWNDFKFRMRGLFATSSVYAQFLAAGEDPGHPNFWTRSDRVIIGHPTADREAKVTRHAASRVVDCNQRQQTAPPDPPRPPVDPLAGLTRPPVPPGAALPDMPPAFCSAVDRINWIRNTLDPLMQPLIDASFAINNYGVDVANARDQARARGDAAAERALTAELEWVDVNHKDVDARYWALARLRDATSVIDCSKKGDDQVGYAPPIRWRLGATVEYSRFGNFEKTAGNQTGIVSVDGASGALGYGVSVGVQGPRWEAGVSAHRNRLELTQTYTARPNGPTRVDGHVDGTFIDLSLGPRFALGRLTIWPFVGATYAINSYDFFANDEQGAAWDGSRSLNTWKGHGGVMFDRPIQGRIGVRLGGAYSTSGKAEDADTNWRMLIGTTFRF